MGLGCGLGETWMSMVNGTVSAWDGFEDVGCLLGFQTCIGVNSEMEFGAALIGFDTMSREEVWLSSSAKI